MMSEKDISVMTDNQILHGDSLTVLATLPDCSIDALVCDPPSGISFMGKSWDTDKGGRDHWISWLSSIMAEAWRVLKPGAHGLVWALPRTSHWTALALEDACFDIRDCCYHIFGSGFPKSLDVSKAIDKYLGGEREYIGVKVYADGTVGHVSKNMNEGYRRPCLDDLEAIKNSKGITAPATPDAQQFAGYGTALKPAVECWWLIRKPLSEKSIAANVLKHGTGGINIDGCRVGSEQLPERKAGQAKLGTFERENMVTPERFGRYPSHLLLSHTLFCTPEQCADGCPIVEMDRQSGPCKGGGETVYPNTNKNKFFSEMGTVGSTTDKTGTGASRYFRQFCYTSKASRRERSAGCDGLPEHEPLDYIGSGIDGRGKEYETKPRTNNHPTVKPVSLMSYLVRMITPPDGIVLDPFGGSGTTALACIAEEKRFILIEKEQEYIDIIHARVEHAYKQKDVDNGHQR